MKIKCENTNEIATSYAEYLVTQHWRDLRVKAYLKSEGVCKICGRHLTNNFICHHVSTGAYERIGKERINEPLPRWMRKLLSFIGIHKEFWKDDVIAVCRHCHNGTSDNHINLHHDIIVPKWARMGKEN